MLKVLKGLHHREGQRITGRMAKRGADGEWEYPLVVESLEAVDLHPTGVYIRRSQTTIAETVACRPIYKLCTELDQITGTIRLVQWWDQDAVNKPQE